VVCDRFIDSTRVYQGAVGKVRPDLLRALERVATQGVRPDLTFILDIDPKIGLQRAAARANGAVADRFEKQSLAYHQAVRDAFLALAQSEPERCVVVNAGDAPEKVAGHIARAVRDRLGVDLLDQPK
jgi:dTMP kinase